MLSRRLGPLTLGWLTLALVVGCAGDGDSRSEEPPPPEATEAARQAVESTQALVEQGLLEDALAVIDSAAPDLDQDHAGLAALARERAMILEGTQFAMAAEAWAAAGDAWSAIEYAPGTVEALCRRAALLPAAREAERQELVKRAARIARNEKRWPLATARALHVNGRPFVKPYPAAAEVVYRAAIDIRRQHAPRTNDLGMSIHNLGRTLESLGRLDEALENYREAVRVKSEVDPSSDTLGSTLYRAGLLAADRGDIELGRSFCERSLEIRRRISEGVEQSLSCVAGIAVYAEDWDRARDYYREMREVAGPGTEAWGAATYSLGFVAHREGEAEEAVAFYREALALRVKIGDLEGVMETHDALGGVLKMLGHKQEALRNFEEAVAVSEEFSPESLAVANTLVRLADFYRGLNEYDAARPYYERAIQIRRRLAPDSVFLAHDLDGLAGLARTKEEIVEAERLYTEAWDIIKRHTETVPGDLARVSVSSRTAGIANNLILARSSLGKHDAALEVFEELRARNFLRVLHERLALEELDPEAVASYRTAERDFLQAGQRLAVAVEREATVAGQFADSTDDRQTADELRGSLETAQRELAEARKDLDRKRNRLDEFERALRRVVPTVEHRPTSELLAALPEDSLFIGYSFGKVNSVVFVLSPESDVSSHIWKARLESLAEKIDRFRALVASNPAALPAQQKVLAEVTELGTELYTELFPEEVRRRIESSDRLVIAPDGPLWHLPFAALVYRAGSDPSWLGTDKAISLTPSLTALLVTKERNGGAAVTTHPLVVGDPVFGFPAPGEIPAAGQSPTRYALFPDGRPPPQLPGTRREAEAIARMYGVDALLGPEATETMVRERIPHAGMVHLASHGYFNEEFPLNGGVLLSPPHGLVSDLPAEDDGCLQVWEFATEARLKADLVVLSACESGAGQQLRGEGIIGFTRVLLHAGARSIVASLWQVSDRSTTRLMEAFHRRVLEGAPKDEALRDAMAELAGSSGAALPYHWAPFFVTGYPESTQRSQ